MCDFCLKNVTSDCSCSGFRGHDVKFTRLKLCPCSCFWPRHNAHAIEHPFLPSKRPTSHEIIPEHEVWPREIAIRKKSQGKIIKMINPTCILGIDTL